MIRFRFGARLADGLLLWQSIVPELFSVRLITTSTVSQTISDDVFCLHDIETFARTTILELTLHYILEV